MLNLKSWWCFFLFSITCEKQNLVYFSYSFLCYDAAKYLQNTKGWRGARITSEMASKQEYFMTFQFCEAVTEEMGADNILYALFFNKQ